MTPGTYAEYHIIAYNVAGSNDFAGVNATTLLAAPTGLSATPSIGAVNLNWSPVAGAVSYNIYRGATSGGESTTPLATGVTATSYIDPTATPNIVSYYVVTAVNANGSYTPPLPAEGAKSNEASSAATEQPAGNITAAVGIGNPPLQGSSALAGSVYTVSGSGVDIYNTSDQFEYAYGSVSGDTTIVARVSSMTFTHTWAKAGIMFRDGTAAGAIFADVVVTPAGYIAFQWRLQDRRAGIHC